VIVIAAVGESLDKLRGHLYLPPAQELADVDVVPGVGGKGGVYRGRRVGGHGWKIKARIRVALAREP
jgi:hypothetical protein